MPADEYGRLPASGQRSLAAPIHVHEIEVHDVHPDDFLGHVPIRYVADSIVPPMKPDEIERQWLDFFRGVQWQDEWGADTAWHFGGPYAPPWHYEQAPWWHLRWEPAVAALAALCGLVTFILTRPWFVSGILLIAALLVFGLWWNAPR